MDEATVQKQMMINVLTNPDRSVVSIVLSCDTPIMLSELKDVLLQYANRIPDASTEDVSTNMVEVDTNAQSEVQTPSN